ncbi:MAG: hypothetical protein IKN81_03800 [Oscillospiraceae bacterium]|nr:hypothetical protein [Oscillospiraceae bacterium]
MTQKKNDNRVTRREKSERNMNRAVLLLTAGLVAEWYLLMADRYYARGTISQVVGWYDYLGVMRWAALAVLAAGVVMMTLRGGKPWVKKLGGLLTGCGAFFTFTSVAMRHYFPVSVTVLCVMVPVLLLLGIIYLFYQAEFSVQATELAMALGAVILLGRSGSAAVKVCAALAVCGIAALLICTAAAKKNGGALRLGGETVQVFAPKADYRLSLGVPVLCLAAVAAAYYAVPAGAFYATWALAIVAFVLAVYYTIKLM